MAEIDTTFLTPHPRTMLWAEQRVQCEACAHVLQQGGALRCRAAPSAGESPITLRNHHPFCIDTREPGAACGPDALLRQPR